MGKKRKGEEEMTAITLEELDMLIYENQDKVKETASRVISDIRSRNLNRGRMRPKNPIEARILARFKRK